MKVLDANLLIYAYDSSSGQHRVARKWLEHLFSSSEHVGIPVQTVAAFLRITTHPRLLRSRLSIEQAVGIVESWLMLPQVRLLYPAAEHWPLLRQTMLDGQASGDLITDAQIAALTVEAGGVLQTNDRDFGRFPGLRWQNPLVQA